MYNVYKIVNCINDKVYIGRTKYSIKKRWQGHMKCPNIGDTRQLYCAMRKYGVENFHIELLEECKDLDDMIAKEAYYCKLYDAYNNGYNMTTAGEINPMECKKSRQSHDNKMRSKEVRDKISQSMKDVRRNSSKTILVHKGKVGKRVSKEELDDYLQNGYELGSNTVGKIRIYNPSIDRENSVWEEDLQKYLDTGWIIGSKPNRISAKQRESLDKSHYKKVYAVTKDNLTTNIFNSLKEAVDWWYNYIVSNNITISEYIKKRPYGLADSIKKSYVKNIYIYDTLWYYIDNEGDDVLE